MPEMCAKVQVNWKLWTLMGEPIADLVLGWKPTMVRIADASGEGSQHHRVENLPEALGPGARPPGSHERGIGVRGRVFKTWGRWAKA